MHFASEGSHKDKCAKKKSVCAFVHKIAVSPQACVPVHNESQIRKK